MNFEIDTSLKQLAMIAYVSSIWNGRSHCNKEKWDILNNGKNDECDSGRDEEGVSQNKLMLYLVNEIKGELRVINLPMLICDQIVHVVIKLGLRLFEWFDFITNRTKNGGLNIPVKHTKALHWTVYGTIDKTKIVETEWISTFDEAVKMAELDAAAARTIQVKKDCSLQCCKDQFLQLPAYFDLKFGLYYMVCACIINGYVNLHWEEMIQFCLKYSQTSFRWTSQYEQHEKKINFIICSVIYLANPDLRLLSLKGNEKSLNDYFKSIECSKEAYMFALSIQEGQEVAVQYYWNSMHLEEREEHSLPAVYTCLSEYRGDIRNIRIGEDKHYALLGFLFINMTENKKVEFFREREDVPLPIHILKIFISSCTLEEFFIPVFNFLKANRNSDGKYEHKKTWFNDVIKVIINAWGRKCDIGLGYKNAMFHQVFFTVWEEVEKLRSDECPLIIESISNKNSKFLNNLYKILDEEILFLILNFECKKRYKDYFLIAGEKKCKDLIENEEYELLDKFIGIALNSKDEESFKKYLDFLFTQLMLRDKFDVIDELPIWKSKSLDERKAVKWDIDIMSVCAKLYLKGDLFLARKSLDWMFLNDEEKTQYINNFEASKLEWVNEILYENQIKGLGKIENNSNFLNEISNFLNWFFDSEDKASKFKNEKMINKNTLKNILEYMYKTGPTEMAYYSIIDGILNFCLSEDKIKMLKHEIQQNLHEWLLYFTNYKNLVDLRKLNDFLDWILEGKSEKQEVIKIFLTSVDGIIFFENIFDYDVVKFLNSTKCLGEWIDFSKNIKKVEWNYLLAKRNFSGKCLFAQELETAIGILKSCNKSAEHLLPNFINPRLEALLKADKLARLKGCPPCKGYHSTIWYQRETSMPMHCSCW